jgi:hypothetical protein
LVEGIHIRTALQRRCGVFRVVFLLLLFASQITLAAQFAGRRVSDVLDELRNEGLTFIYNTGIVADDMVIATEPRAASGMALAR